jgi:acyl CoA:acetate/3-ketoacid CoA transferase beta subunit
VTLAGSSATGGKVDPARDRIVRRAAKEFKDGMYVNLGKSSRG